MEKIAVILLLILFRHLGTAQEAVTGQYKYKVTYNLTYQPDSTDINSQKSENMYLYIGDNTSRFSSAGKAIGDSLQSTFDYSNFNQAAFMRMRNQIPKTDFEYSIYKGIPAQKITYTREIVTDKYRYTEDKNIFNWAILEQRDTIAGYQVQKAATSFAGRNYIAWFTNEVPLPEGPYKFNGLPGLIVKIGDDKSHYLFEITEIKKIQNPISFIFNEGEFIETTPEKLVKLEEEYKKDPVGFTKRSVPGVRIEYGPGTDIKKIERERKERLKKENNPLELE